MVVDHLDFPIGYSSGKTGQASLTRPADGTSPDSPDRGPLVKTLLDTVPAPVYDAEEPLRAQVTNLDASPYLGRLALLRIHSGEMKNGQQVAWCKVDGTISRVKITELLVTEGLTRTPADSAGPGELVAIAGIEDIMIGDTLADPNDPRPLPPLTVDEPSISITIGINTAPLSGRSVGSMRTDTLPTSSWSSRFLIRRAVSFLPDRPASGAVLIPMVIEIDGSSTVSGGSGRGSFGSARVSPIMMSSIPAMATSSPGPALSAGVRVRPSVTSSSVILTRVIVPSTLHQATCWPFFISPEWMRSRARRPR
jgi:hypothetical protein